jgi:putative nucleotidyltransferase with HDIG domain
MQLQQTLEMAEGFDNEAIMRDDLEEAVDHGILVSKLAFVLSKELNMDDEFCYIMAEAGLVHDIGKLKLGQHLYGRSKDTLVVEEMKYIRMHPSIGLGILEEYDYSKLLLDSVYHHHENYDGSGYPCNLVGDNIPIGGRILRICDVYAALISDRRYRAAFDKDTAVRLLIEEVKNFDMQIFLAFLSVVHSEKFKDIDHFVAKINTKNFLWRRILHDGYY